MAKQYDITVGNDGKAVVVLSPACKMRQDDILALLRQLGFDSRDVTFLEPDQVGECQDLKGSPVIIPIDEATCDLPELDGAGRHCGDAGGHVIVLFGPDYQYEGFHPIADKYGTQCGWSPDHLKGCMPGKVDAPRDGSGARQNRTEARQVDC